VGIPWEQLLSGGPVAVVAAHPDDETVGAGGLLTQLVDPIVVTVTDGSPRDPGDRERAGCATREEYARLRRDELRNALAVAGIGPERARGLQIGDQEASLEMAYLTLRIADLFRRQRPAAVVTHPYEGGHPDHDATAFVVHSACARLDDPPPVFEFCSYHAAAGNPEMELGCFLPGGDCGEALPLCDGARERKQRMISCFASQLYLLKDFPTAEERFRRAPVYDFTAPPHAGKLFYEYFDWGFSGDRWRQLAGDTLRRLDGRSEDL